MSAIEDIFNKPFDDCTPIEKCIHHAGSCECCDNLLDSLTDEAASEYASMQDTARKQAEYIKTLEEALNDAKRWFDDLSNPPVGKEFPAASAMKIYKHIAAALKQEKP